MFRFSNAFMHRVYGSGRLYRPTQMAMQAPGKAYLYGDQQQAAPLINASLIAPSSTDEYQPSTWQVPRNPDPVGTDVVGAGILEPYQGFDWVPNTPFRPGASFAIPGYIAREPNEGWWVSEGKDWWTGARSWVTNLVGLDGFGALGAPSRTMLFALGALGIAAGLYYFGKGKSGGRRRARRSNAGARSRNPYRIWIGVDANGNFLTGARDVKAHAVESAQVYGSQLPYQVTAQDAEGDWHLTTRTQAKQLGWHVKARGPSKR